VPFSDVAWIALLGTLSGLMIGCIGIGGVILVPALVFVAGIAIQIAIPAAMCAYIVSGLVASYVFARNRSIDWRMATSLCIGGTPAAFAGAWAVSVIDGRLLAGCLGVLTLLAGLMRFGRTFTLRAIVPSYPGQFSSLSVWPQDFYRR
jgi:uncharacterized protein